MAAAEKSHRELIKVRSIFDLPSDFFDSCSFLLDNFLIFRIDEPYPSHQLSSGNEEVSAVSVGVALEPYSKSIEEKVKGTTQRWTCNTCKSEFESLQDQRSHFKSDIHRLNIKLSVAGKNIVKEEEFDEQGCDFSFENFDVSSISGSEDELEKGAFAFGKTHGGGKHKLYLRLRSGEMVSIWRSLLLSESEEVCLDDYKVKQARNDGNASVIGEEELSNRLKHLLFEPREKSHLRTVLLLSGGHFAGCVFDANSIIAHKTFHRYVVRAKAGKKQSTNDASGKSARSAGSSLRRYNEAALKKEIEDLLVSWKQYIISSSCIFIHAPSRNRQILFDGEKHLLFHDRATKQIPLTVRRPTLKEVRRIYLCLTQLSYEEEPAPFIKHEKVKHSPMALPVERAAAPLTNDLENTSLSYSEKMSSPLHSAVQDGDAQRTLELLEEGCNPCLKDERGRTPYMLATEKEVRNIFRRFMAANLDKWDWHEAKVPSPLTKEMEESQTAKQMEKDAKRKAKAKELKMLRKAKEKSKEHERRPENDTSVLQRGSTSVRKAPSKQFSEEGTKQKLLSRQEPKLTSVQISKEEEEKAAIAEGREKRAAAAERRIADSMKSGSSETNSNHLLCSCCNASLDGKIPFHRYHYFYCSTTCMHLHS